MSRMFSAASCVLLLSSSLPVASADAQSTPKTEESAGELQEIIVTASRREESSQKAALAIQPITAEELSRAGVTQPEDLNAIAAGVSIATGGNFPQVYIRGVGNFATNMFAEGAVAMNLDGVYISRGWAVRGSFFDLERVEVLKGPQGTLYGRNASGGALNLITARPSQEFGGHVEAEVGDYDLWRGAGAVNLPISPEFAVRAAGQIIRRDGYLSDGYDDEESEAARLHALWTPSDDVSLLLTGSYQQMGGQGPGAVLLPRAGDAWRGPSDPLTAAIYAAQPIFGPLIGPSAPDRSGSLDAKVYSASAELNWQTAAGMLTVIPAYRDAKLSDRHFLPGFLVQNHDHDRQTSFETRFTHESDWLKLVVGGYYFDEKQNDYGGNPELLVAQGVNAQIIDAFDSEIRSYAGFGQATVSVTPELRFTGGLRYTYERKGVDASSIDYGGVPDGVLLNQPPSQWQCPPSFPPFPPPGSPFTTLYLDTPQPPLFCGVAFPIQGKLTYNSWTYKVGAEYDLGPQSLLYANVSTGFKSGGFFLAPEPNSYKPEKLRAYALGSKNRFFNNRLQFNTEVFYWDYKDHQESHVGPTAIPGFFTFITENAGRATLYGIDFDITLLITDNDRLDVKLQYEHSEYDSFSYGYPTAGLGGVPPHTGCDVSPFAPVQTVDCAGKQVARAPDWTGTVAYAHTFRLGNGGELTASTQTQFASSSYLSIDFLPELKQDAYAVVDLDLQYVEPNEKWSVSAYVRNVGDEPVYTSAFAYPFVAPNNPVRPEYVNWATIRAPRTFGAQFRYNF